MTATFNEPLAPAHGQRHHGQLRDPAAQLVAASVTLGPGHELRGPRPRRGLAYSTTYTATVKGGPGGVTDVAGNPLAADVSWTFTTQAPPPPPPTEGPGGPILVVKSSGNPFSGYYAEILRAEGLNAFEVLDITGGQRDRARPATTW